MKFLSQTFAYLKKSFWLLAAVMAVPAIAACFLLPPYWEVSFVAAVQPKMNMGQTFFVIFGDSWAYLWPVVVVSALQIFASALCISAIDRHFRTGKLSLRSPWRLINNSVFSIFIGVLIMSALSVLLRIMLFGIVSLMQVIAGASGMNNGALLSLIAFFAVAMFVLHVLIITPMLYWAPIMFVYGYRFRDAAGVSFKLIAGKRVYAGLLLPTLLCAGLQLLIAFLGVHPSVSITVNFFVFLFTNVYVVAFTVLTFYEISGLERRDIKRYATFVLPPTPAKTETDGKAEKSKKQTKKSPAVKIVNKPASKKTVKQKSAPQTAPAQKKREKKVGNNAEKKPSGKTARERKDIRVQKKIEEPTTVAPDGEVSDGV